MEVNVPDEFDDFSDVLIWNESTENILIKNNSEKIILKLDGHNKNKFNEFKSYIENNNSGIFKIKLLNMVSNSDSVTQLGQYDESKIENVDNLFYYPCNECDKETKYQIKGKYGGRNAECVHCGNHASIIIDDCKSCSKKCVFVKTLDESYYNCYKCNQELF